MRVQTNEREEDRGLAQALSRTQFAPQGRRLSLGAFDADVLYQPRRQDLAEDATRAAGQSERRIKAAVGKRLDRRPGEGRGPRRADRFEAVTPIVFPSHNRRGLW